MLSRLTSAGYRAFSDEETLMKRGKAGQPVMLVAHRIHPVALFRDQRRAPC